MRHPFRRLLSIALSSGAHPLCAGNKFEIIGGGVAGSGADKQAFIEAALYGGAGVALLLAVLSVLVPHRNPLFLNYANWRQSAIAFAVIAALCLGAALASG